MLWKYLHHLVRETQESFIPGNPFSILLAEHFNLTWKEFMTWRLQDSNQNTSSVSNTGYRGQSKQDSRYDLERVHDMETSRLQPEDQLCIQ